MSFLNALAAYPAGLQYTISSGTKSPTLGISSASWPPSGWSSVQNASQDDSFVQIPLPFTFYFNNTAYQDVFVGSNQYMTFGSGTNVFSGLSSTNPALDKIFLNAADRSFQRVAYINATDFSYVRIRYEGATGTSGTPGSSTVIYEATFFRPANTGMRPTIEFLVGTQNSTGGIVGLYSAGGTSLSSFASFAANQSYVLRQSGGISGNFDVNTGSYIGNSGY